MGYKLGSEILLAISSTKKKAEAIRKSVSNLAHKSASSVRVVKNKAGTYSVRTKPIVHRRSK